MIIAGLLNKYLNFHELKRTFHELKNSDSGESKEVAEEFVKLCRDSFENLGKYKDLGEIISGVILDEDNTFREEFVCCIVLQTESIKSPYTKDDYAQYLGIFKSPSPNCIMWFYNKFVRTDNRIFKPDFFIVLVDGGDAKDGVIPLSQKKLEVWHKKYYPGRRLLYSVPKWALSYIDGDEKRRYNEDMKERWARCTTKLEDTELIKVNKDKDDKGKDVFYIYPSEDLGYEGLAYWCTKAQAYVEGAIPPRIQWKKFADFIRKPGEKEVDSRRRLTNGKDHIVKKSLAEMKNKPYFDKIQNCFNDDYL